MTNSSLRSTALKAFCFGVLLFVSQIAIFAQDASEASLQTQVAQTESVDSASPSQPWNWNDAGYAQEPRQSSTFGLFVKMVFALAVVLALAYLVVRFLKRTTNAGGGDDPFLRQVAHLPLSAGKSVDIVTIVDKAFVLGVTDNSVNLIGELTDKELIDSLNLYSDKNDNTKRPRSFADVLDLFMPHGPRSSGNGGVYGQSARSAADVLRRQRERLNEEE